MEARAEDWVQVGEIRLRALAEAPQAFASRLADERDRPESVWRDRLSSPDASTFLALDDREAVGLVTVIAALRTMLVRAWSRCG